jgi:hypothetical protein
MFGLDFVPQLPTVIMSKIAILKRLCIFAVPRRKVNFLHARLKQHKWNTHSGILNGNGRRIGS